MKKTILREILLILVLAVVSTVLYQLIYGIDLRYPSPFVMMTFDIRPTIIVLEIIGIFLLPGYLLLNLIRLFRAKFQKLYLLVEALITSVVLIVLFYYKYRLLTAEENIMAQEGWTIYPSLPGLLAVENHEANAMRKQSNFLLILMLLLCVLTGALTAMALKLRKKAR